MQSIRKFCYNILGEFIMDTTGMTDDEINAYIMQAAVKLPRDEAKVNALSNVVRQTAYEIHKYLGIGYLEKVYENTLKHRLENLGHEVLQQVKLTVKDQDGFVVGWYEADLVIDRMMICELKAVKCLNSSHEAQLINYLKTTGIKDGMLINFGSPKFQAIKRVLSNHLYAS
jgi:GxxExxY protein